MADAVQKMIGERPDETEQDQLTEWQRATVENMLVLRISQAAAINHHATSSVPADNARPVARWTIDVAIVTGQR